MKIRSFILSTAAVLAAVSAANAADLPVKAPVAVPVARHWDGFWVGFSAGSQWTDVTAREIDNSVNSISVVGVEILRNPYTYTDNLSGSETGAVFTFTTGYNLVWGAFVLGLQTDVSYNLGDVTVNGTGRSHADINLAVIAPGLTLASLDRTGDVTGLVRNTWTVSEMARIGWLVWPDTQLYGLIGWSWGGFRFSDYAAGRTGLEALLGTQVGGFSPTGRNDVASTTLNGFTWGVGLEKDFGWLRGFIQYKGINYGSDDVQIAKNASNTLTILPGILNINATDSVTGRAVRSISADVTQVTAGFVIPLNYGPRW